MIKTIRIGAHIPDCFAVKNFNEGKWNTPWSIFHKFKFGSKSHPNRRGNYAWSIVNCNNHECRAKLAVFQDDIFKLLGSGEK
jgi:hypothetical protein